MFRFWKLIQLSTTIFFLIAGFHASRHSKQINMINIKSKTVQEIKSRICETKGVDVNIQRLRSEQFFLSRSFHLFFRSFPSVHTHSVAKGGLLIVLSKICRFFFTKRFCIDKSCWCPSGWAPTWRPYTNRNNRHWVLLQKLEFISRGIQKH